MLAGCGSDAAPSEEGQPDTSVATDATGTDSNTSTDSAGNDSAAADSTTADTASTVTDSAQTDSAKADSALVDANTGDVVVVPDGEIDLDGGVEEDAGLPPDDGGVIDLDGGIEEDAAPASDVGADTKTDSGVCTNTEVNSTSVVATCSALTLKNFGGTIAAGTYKLSSVRRVSLSCADSAVYNVASSMTITSKGGALAFTRVRSLQTGLIRPTTFRESGTITTLGTAITMTISCPVGAAAKSGAYTFTAGDAGKPTFRLDVTESNARWLYTYTQQ